MKLHRLPRRFLIGLVAALTWILALGVAGTASAQGFSDLTGTGFTARGPGSAPTANVTVSANYDVTSISTVSQVTSAHNMRFFIYNLTTTTVLYSSAAKAFPADGGLTTKTSDPFAAVTLTPGNTYLIGAVADTAGSYYYSVGSSLTSGVVTNVDSNGQVSDFAATTFGCCAGARVNLALGNAAPAAVPTMSEWAMILLGLMLAGGAALYIQRRQMIA